MKHPDEVKASRLRAEALRMRLLATEHGSLSRINRDQVRDAYMKTCEALGELASALEGRAKEFDESARLTK